MAPAARHGLARAADGFAAWLTASHLHRVVRVLLILQIGGFMFFVAGTHGAFGPQPSPPTTTDFASFYSAGLLADRGMAGLVYDQPTLRAAGEQAIAPGIDFNPFLNPPIFLLICAPLARLPYLVAFVLFEAVTVIFWLVVATRIAGGGGLAGLTLAAIPSVWWALGWGQNSFLTAGLMGAGTLLLRRRPGLAGAVLGALCFKPHFGVLLPVAFLAGREWRALLGAALSVAGLGALTTLCFGTEAWRGFFGMALHARATIESGRIAFAGHVDMAGAVRLLGASAPAGWGVQVATSLLAAGCVAWIWHRCRRWAPDRDAGEAARQAALVAGTLTAMPFLLFYDLVMASVAAAWLARAARQLGWRRFEPALLSLLLLIDFLAYPAALQLHVAIGTAVAPCLLGLALRLGPARKRFV